jgi:hypothetical protein
VGDQCPDHPKICERVALLEGEVRHMTQAQETLAKAIEANTEAVREVKGSVRSPGWPVIMTGILITAIANADKVSTLITDLVKLVKGG